MQLAADRHAARPPAKAAATPSRSTVAYAPSAMAEHPQRWTVGPIETAPHASRRQGTLSSGERRRGTRPAGSGRATSSSRTGPAGRPTVRGLREPSWSQGTSPTSRRPSPRERAAGVRAKVRRGSTARTGRRSR